MTLPYTVSFGRAVGTANTDHLLLLVDEFRHYVLRDVVLGNRSIGPAVIIVYVAAPGAPGLYLVQLEVPENSTLHVDLRQALLAGEELRAFSTASSWAVVCTGYAFSLA